jgi:virginiamycin B lyase
MGGAQKFLHRRSLVAAFACCCVLPFAARSYAQDRFPKFDATQLPITARIHIGGDPDWLAVGFGSVWVAVPKNNEIVRVDPQHNVVQARIAVDKEPCYGIGMGAAKTWVLNCKSQTLTRIDPRSNQVDLRVPAVIAPEGEGSIAVGKSGVWYVSNEDGHSSTLVQASQITGRTLRKIKVGAESAVVNLGFGSVWVTSSGEGKIYRVNPQTGKVIGVITVNAKPRFTTIAAGSVWVLSQSDGNVSRIDPATNTVKSIIKVNVPGAGGDISSGGDWIWVAAAGTPLTRISSATGAIADQYGNYAGADAIRYGFHAVWISDHRKGDLWKIDPGKLPEYSAHSGGRG